jgi:gamma-F420-2:alpha-L-glutamate ligase
MSVIIITKNERNEYETARLLESFSNKNIDAIACHPDNFDLIVSNNLQEGIKYNGKFIDLPKIILCRLGAGILPFQLAVLRQFEESGITCVNASQSINTVRDKLRASQILARSNLPIPKTIMVRWPIDDTLIETTIGFPCVIKVVTGSYGEGVYLCEKKRDYKKLMEFIDNLGAKKTLIVQEYMSYRPGEDLRVYVVGGKVLGAMKRSAPEGDFRANISSGGTGEPFPVSDDIEYLALETAKVLNLDIAGIDLLFDEGGFKICEANSNPGFAGFEKFCQVNIADKITEYIKFKMQ